MPPIDPTTSPPNGDPVDAGAGDPNGYPSTPATPTATYSAGDDRTPGGDAHLVAELIAGALGVAAMFAGWVISRRAGLQLREPTERQRDDIAAPLASVAVRHLDMTRLSPDLADMLEAGKAAGGYITDGPLIRHADVTTDTRPREETTA
jgi:hypothetical protein